MSTQYDEVVEIFPLAHVLLFRPYLEHPTVLDVLGSVVGKSVLDVACGDGLYARLVKQKGATTVVGVDIAEELIHAARQIEEKMQLGITYFAYDAAEMPVLGSFDVVLATYLLHYAPTEEQIQKMCRCLYANVKPSGRLIAITVNPDYSMAGPKATKYGITMQMPEDVKEGDRIDAVIHTEPSFTIHSHYWKRETYERALADAGFRNIRWTRPKVSAEGEQKFGREFWQDYIENPHLIVVDCDR